MNERNIVSNAVALVVAFACLAAGSATQPVASAKPKTVETILKQIPRDRRAADSITWTELQAKRFEDAFDESATGVDLIFQQASLISVRKDKARGLVLSFVGPGFHVKPFVARQVSFSCDVSLDREDEVAKFERGQKYLVAGKCKTSSLAVSRRVDNDGRRLQFNLILENPSVRPQK